MKRVVIVGCGETGTRLARLHREAGDQVTVTNTSNGKSRFTEALLQEEGGSGSAIRDSKEPRFLLLDLDQSGAVLEERFDTVHCHVPPPREGDTDPRIARLLAALPPPARFIYISATSVYGDHGGAWVDEDTPPQPGSDRGRRRLDAERQVERWCAEHGVTAVILRAAGIYGTGRPRPTPRDPAGALRPVNRIHVDDLAAIAFAAATRPDAAGIYNCADGAPTMEPAGVYGSEAKKIRARRIVRGLGVTLRYPAFVNDPE